MTYRLWVNPDSTVLVRMWESGRVEVATRSHRKYTWGPPIQLLEEDVTEFQPRSPTDILFEAAARILEGQRV